MMSDGPPTLPPPPPLSDRWALFLDVDGTLVPFADDPEQVYVSARLIERLDQVAADIGSRECNVTVTGYSSKEGSIASNALFAVERAQNSLAYLREKGVRFNQASATGVGATDEFGPDFASNRRVVITVKP